MKLKVVKRFHKVGDCNFLPAYVKGVVLRKKGDKQK